MFTKCTQHSGSTPTEINFDGAYNTTKEYTAEHDHFYVVVSAGG